MRDRCPILCFCLIAAACSPPGGNETGNAANQAAPANAAASPASAPAATNAAAPAANASTAAASTKAAPGTAGATYAAAGTEPFWALSIGGGQMAYSAADGPNVTEPLPAQQSLTNGYRYQGTRLVVTVDHTPCDSVDDTTHPDTVTVVVDGTTVTGCGG